MNLPTYAPHRDREARIRSAVTAIKALLPLELYPSHKKELISVCIWKITEADGKMKTRFRSIESINAEPGEKLQHEHVYERKSLIERVLMHPDNVESVLEDAIGCIVTKSEHDRLNQVSRKQSTLEGWQRYKEAGIRVIDLEGQCEVSL